MNYSDEELKSALRRREPPDRFAERVLARVAAETASQSAPRRRSWRTFFTQPLARWAAAAVVAGALIAGGIHYRNLQRERAEGEAAKQQLMLGLRIAGSKLQLAKAKVNDINVDDGKNHQVKE
jgi:hypothetical protein